VRRYGAFIGPCSLRHGEGPRDDYRRVKLSLEVQAGERGERLLIPPMAGRSSGGEWIAENLYRRAATGVRIGGDGLTASGAWHVSPSLDKGTDFIVGRVG